MQNFFMLVCPHVNDDLEAVRARHRDAHCAHRTLAALAALSAASTYRVTAAAPVPAGTVSVMEVSGYSIPVHGTVQNTISGDGSTHSVAFANGKGPC